MSLRKSPIRSVARLAASRAAAQRSTGPRTLEGKSRSRLNALRHGRRSRTLYRVLPYPQGGLSFDDRLLYNWILRAIRNSFPPRTPRQEAKILRTALQVWRQMKSELEGKNDQGSLYVAEKWRFGKDTSCPRSSFRLEGREGRGVLRFQTYERGRIPQRKRVVGGGRTVNGRGESPRVVPTSQHLGSGWQGQEARRARTVMAVWRGEGLMQDWSDEPVPDRESDPAGYYHWQRDLQQAMRRGLRALRREQAREEREAGEAGEEGYGTETVQGCGEALIPVTRARQATEDWLAAIRALCKGGTRAPGALPGAAKLPKSGRDARPEEFAAVDSSLPCR